MKRLSERILKVGALGLMMALCSCTAVSNVLNPFYEQPSPVAVLGEANDHALDGTMSKEDTARKALEAMATYQRAHTPQPVNPVMEAAVVRLMWVPDHLNKNGDLVPAHYYYLKVKGEQWAVTDAFERESQLAPQGIDGSNLPFIYDSEKVN